MGRKIMLSNDRKSSLICRKYIILVGFVAALFFAISILPNASAQEPEFINAKWQQSVDQVNWNDVDGTLHTGFTMALNSTVTQYYLTFKNACTNVSLAEGFYGFNLNSHPSGFFGYWDGKGVNSSATPGSWQEHAWDIINGDAPTFYIHVDANQDFSLIDGLQRDYYGVGTALYRVNGDYLLGSYSYNGTVLAEDNTSSEPIDINMEFVDEIKSMDEPVMLLFELQQSVNLINWDNLYGSLYSGYTSPVNTSESYYRFDVRDFSIDRELAEGFYGFYITSYPSGFFAYWASQGVDASATPGTWQAHMWDIINGNAPRFYISVEGFDGPQDLSLIDGLLKDYYGFSDALLRINGDLPLGMYTYTGSVTSMSGIDSDMIDVFLTFLDNSTCEVWVDDNYDIGTPGWGVTHFASINNAISVSVDGGIVTVKPGTYEELVQIDKPVILRSTFSAGNTMISDFGKTYSQFLAVGGHTVQIASDHVFIGDFTIRRYESVVTTAAVGNNDAPNISHVEIRNCIIETLIDCMYFSQMDNISLYSNSYNALPDDTIFVFTNVTDFLIMDDYLEDYTYFGGIFDGCVDGNIYNLEVSYKRRQGISINRCEGIYIAKTTFRGIEEDAVYVNDSINIGIRDTIFADNYYGVSLGDDTIILLINNSYGGNERNINRAACIEGQDLYYSQLQAVINISNAGGSINVYPGTYPENLIINKTIELHGVFGADAEDIVLQGNNATPTVLIAPNETVWNVVIDGLTIKGGNHSLKTGRYQDVSGLTIQNCIIGEPDLGYAVYIDPYCYADVPPIRNGSDLFFRPVVFDNNDVTGGVYYHFWPYEVYGVTVPRQLSVLNSNIDRIFLNGSISVKFYKNNIESLGMMYSSDITINQNTFDNPWQERYGIYLWSVNGTPPVKDIDITHNIIVGYSSFAVSSGISGQGIVIAGAMDVTIQSNEITANTDGIWIAEEYNNSNGERCIGDVFDITIKDNDIENGQTGIKLHSNVNGTHIIGNSININGKGIWIHGSGYHVIANNTIIGNYNGIRFDNGSDNNLIYNNYFSDNYINVYDLYSITNIWNVSLRINTNIMGGPYVGGNLWHDYMGDDTNGDSIGDTDIPYNCSGYIANGGDYLPLKLSDITPPSVHVSYPNGGESINGTITIAWTASDDFDTDLSIDIRYSNNSGASWNMISPNEENDGSYEWDTSMLPEGSNYMVRISATDNAGHTSNDTSDGTFSIYIDVPGPDVSITNPLLGYVYFFNMQKIRFLSNNCFAFGHIVIDAEIDTLLDIEKVEFYIDNQLVHTSYTAIDNVYSWEWDEIALFYHEVMVKAYDIHGGTGADSIGITIFNLGVIP